MNKGVHKKRIQEIIQKSTQNPAVKKVVLFGSHAYCRPSRDSDIDLLFIADTKLKGMQRHRWINSTLSHILPLDILVKTPSEIKKRIAMGDPFYKEVLEKGLLIYASK